MMTKSITNKILLGLYVLAAAAVLGGGLYVVAYNAGQPLTVKVLKRVAVKPTVDPETIFDETVSNSGRAYVEKQGKDGKIDYEYRGKFVSYRAEDGVYKDIDTNVMQAEDKKSYVNSTNVSGSQFAASSNTDSLVAFGVAGGRGLDFGFVDATSVDATVSKNTVTYAGILPGFDAKYTINAGEVLEELIAAKKFDTTRISQRMNLTGIYYKVQQDRSIIFYDSKTHNKVFTVPKPVLYEQRNPDEKNYGIYYEIQQDGDSYLIDKVFDADGIQWLKTASYPVVIDLSVAIPPPSFMIWPSQNLISGNPDIMLTWSTVTGATNYFVQYSTDNATWSAVCTISAGNHSTTACSSGLGTHLVGAGLVQFNHSAALPGQRAYYRMAVAGTAQFGSPNGVLTIPGLVPYDFEIDNLEGGDCAPYGCMYVYGSKLYHEEYPVGSGMWGDFTYRVVQKRKLQDGSLLTTFGGGDGEVRVSYTIGSQDSSYKRGMDVDSTSIFLALGGADCGGPYQRPAAAAYNKLTGAIIWEECYSVAEWPSPDQSGEIHDVVSDNSWVYFTGDGSYGPAPSIPRAIVGRINRSTGVRGWVGSTAATLWAASAVAIDSAANGFVYSFGRWDSPLTMALTRRPKDGTAGGGTLYFATTNANYLYRMLFDPTSTNLYASNVWPNATPSDAQYFRMTTGTFALSEAAHDPSNYPDKAAGGIAIMSAGAPNRYVFFLGSTQYGAGSDWFYLTRSVNSLLGGGGNVLSTGGKEARGVAIDSLDQYLYGFGTDDSDNARIEKRYYPSYTLGNVPCDVGQSEYPACLQYGGSASPAYRNVRTTAVSTAPTVTALSWNRLRVNVASTFLPNSGTSPRPNPTTTELCIGTSYTDWPNQGVPSGSAGIRYFGNLYNIGPYEFYLTPRDSNDSSASPSAEVIENNVTNDYYRPKCMSAASWNIFGALETYRAGSGALPLLYPNRAYSVGLYSRQLDDAVDSEGGRVTAPSATTTVYTWPRQVIAPVLAFVANQPTSLKVTIPDGTQSGSIVDDPAIAGDDRGYTNPSTTKYSVRLGNGYYMVPSAGGATTTTETFGTYAQWGGASGMINTGGLGITAAGCYTVTVRAVSDGTPLVNSASSSASNSLCTAPATPTVNCTTNNQCNVSTTSVASQYYNWEHRYCNLDGSVCGGWTNAVTCTQAYASYADTYPATVGCGPDRSRMEYRVRVSATPTTCANPSDWSPYSPPSVTRTVGWDSVPPCAPTNLGVSMKGSTSLNLNWDWTQVTHGGQTVDTTGFPSTTNYSFRARRVGPVYCYPLEMGEDYRECTLVGLTPNTSYTTDVQGRDDMGTGRTGAWSSTIQTYTYAANPTITVTCTDTVCTVRLTSFNSNPAITNYLLQRCDATTSCPASATDDTNWVNIDTGWKTYGTTVPVNIFTDSGRVCGTEYRYRLKARNTPGEITPNTPVILRQTNSCLPSLFNVTPSFNLANNFCVNWRVAPGTGITPASYNFYNTVDGSGVIRANALYAGNPTSNLHCDATSTWVPNQQIIQSVRGVNTHGTVGAYNAHSGYTAANRITINSVTCSVTGCNVALTRNLNPDNTKFQLERRSCTASDCSDNPAWGIAAAWRTLSTLSSDTYSDTGLACTNAYVQYRVRVRNNDNELETDGLAGYFFTKDAADGYSPAFTPTPMPPCPPSWKTPAHDNQTPFSINWVWNASSTSTVTGYKVYNATSSSCSSTLVATLSKASNCSGANCFWNNNSGISENTRYYRCVSAYNVSGDSAKVGPVSAYSGIRAVTGINFGTPTSSSIPLTAAPGSFVNLGVDNSRIRFHATAPNGDTLGSWAASIPPGYSGWLNANDTNHTSLGANAQYCYKAETVNGDAFVANDYTTELPSTAVCKYTYANTPGRPILQPLPAAEMRIKVQENLNPSPTQFAICITRYNADGTVNADGYLQLDATDGNLDARTTVDWTLACNSIPDAIGNWDEKGINTSIGGWNGDNGVVVTGLDADARYEYKVKARNQEGVVTAFGPVATLFLVKNNIVGWAWSTNAGWISLNCKNFFANPPANFSCDIASDWGINSNFEPSRDINPLEGYAWSSSGMARNPSYLMEDKTLTVNGGNGLLSSVEYSFKEVAFDGQYLWAAPHRVLVGQRPSLLYRIDPVTFVADKYDFSAAFPDEDLMRLVFDGKDLWATGQTACRLYRFSTANANGYSVGDLIETIPYGDASCATPDSGQSGLVWDAKDFWIASRNGVVRIRRGPNIGDTKEINCNGTLPTPTPVRCTLNISESQQPYFDGQWIWVNNFNDKSISRIDRTDGVPTASQVKKFSFTSATAAWPREIVYDGKYYWVSHSDATVTAGYVSILKVAGDVGTWVRSDFQLQPAGGVIMGLLYDNKNVWAAGYDSGKVYRIRAATGLSAAPEIETFTPNNQPFKLTLANGSVWAGLHSMYDTNLHIPKFSFGLSDIKTGLGWLSLNVKACSNDSQRGCFKDADCLNSATCDTVTGPPPGGTMYGYCYNATDATGRKYGKCSDNGANCAENNVGLCSTPATATCIYYTCKSDGDACPDVGVTEECRPTTTANFNGSTRGIEGWARALSQKISGTTLGFSDWGWIRLAGTYDNGRGDSGPYQLTGTEVDSQQFLGDPSVNPNDVKLYSVFGWGWGAETSDYYNKSSWLSMVNVSNNRLAFNTKYADKVQLRVDETGNQHVSWIGYDGTTGKWEIFYVKHQDGRWQTVSGAVYTGDTSVADARVTASTDADPSELPDGVSMLSMDIDNAGIPHFAWEDGGFWTYREGGVVKYTTWDGTAWLTTIIDGSESQVPSIEIDSADHPHIIYRSGGYGSATVKYTYWNGTAWSVPSNVSSSGIQLDWPDFILRDDAPVVVWGQPDGTNNNIYLRWWDATANSGAGGWVDVDPSDGNYTDDQVVNTGITIPPTGYYAKVALYPDGHPGVLWREGGTDGDRLYFRQWNAGLGAWTSVSNDGNNQQIDLNRTYDIYGRQNDLAIDRNGIVHVVYSTLEGSRRDVYHAQSSGAAWVTAARTAPAGASGGQLDPLYNISLTTESGSQNSAMSLDRFGNVHVIWEEVDANTAGAACITNADCQASGYASCLDFHAYGMRCANVDVMYSRWMPGNVQSGLGWVEFMPAGALLGIPWVKTMFADIHASQNITLAPPPRGTGEYTSTYLIETGGTISGIPGYYGGTTTGAPTSQLPDQAGFPSLIQNRPSIQTLGAELLAKLDVDGLVNKTNGDKNRHGTIVAESTTTELSTNSVFGTTPSRPILNNKVYYFHGTPGQTFTISNDMYFMKGLATATPATRGNGVIVVDGNLEVNANLYYQKWCENDHALVCRQDTDCVSVGGTCNDPAISNLIELPSAAIIVRGNIYINPLVHKVSAVVVAIDNPDTVDDPVTTDVVENMEGIVSSGRKAPADVSVARSQDDTWVNSNTTNHPVSSSAFFGKDNDVLIGVTNGSAGMMYESQPGGETWDIGSIPANQGPIISMLKASNGDIYLGRGGYPSFSNGYVNRSADNGQTWVTSNNFNDCPITTLLEAPNHDIFIGFGCSKASVYRLPYGAPINGGWVNTAAGVGGIDFSGTQADVVNSMIRAANGDIIVGTTDSTGGRVYRLTYIGPLWDNKWNQIENRTLGSFGVSALAQTANGDMYAGTNSSPAAVFRLPNATATWQSTGAIQLPGGAYREQAVQSYSRVNALLKASTGVLYAGMGGNKGDVFQYNTGTNNWDATANMTEDPTPAAQYSGDEVYPRSIYVLSEGADHSLYAGSQVVFNTSQWSGEVYKTTDWGVTWDRVFNTLVGGTSVNALLQNALDQGGTKFRSMLRFSLPIPGGAEIKSAYLKLQGDGTGSGEFNARLYLIDGDNANTIDFASTPNPALYNILTSNSVNFPIENNWTAGTWYQTPDLKAIVQRFVNRDNYGEGNYIGLAIKEGDAAVGESRGFRTFDSDPANAPQLIIEYAPRRTLYKPSATTDDVQAWSTGSDSAAVSQRIGWNAGAMPARAERSFLRLGPVAGQAELPVEAEIIKARLVVTKDTANADAATFQLRQGLLTPNNANGDFDAFSGNPYLWPVRIDVSEMAEDVTGAWTTAGTYHFTDIKRLIQDWVDDAQYTQGYYLGLSLRRGENEDTATAGASRSFKSQEAGGATQLEIDYQIPLSVSGLFVAGTGYNFDRKYTKNLAPAEQILYDGRVVANTPPGLSDFITALPIYHRVTP